MRAPFSETLADNLPLLGELVGKRLAWLLMFKGEREVTRREPDEDALGVIGDIETLLGTLAQRVRGGFGRP